MPSVTAKNKTKARRKRAPSLTLWSSTIASTQGLLTGIRFARVNPSAQRIAEAEEEVRARLRVLATPIRPEAFARSVR